MQIPNGKQLTNAARGLMLGNFEQAVKSFYREDFSPRQLEAGVHFVANTSPDTYRGAPNELWEFSIDGNGYNYFKYAGIGSAQLAYNTVPQLQAIINKKASAISNGKTWLLDGKDKVSNGQAARKMRALMERPNPLQTWRQFDAQAYIYEQVFGYSVMLAVKPFGFEENIDASKLWNIPPNMVSVKESGRLWYQTDQAGIIDTIEVLYRGERTALSLKDVLITKDFVPSMSSMIFPSSRIEALEYPINNILGAYQSRNTLIHYRGALGIFSQDGGTGAGGLGALPMTATDKKDLQDDLRRYGLKRNQIQFIITKAALKWQQVGVPVKDLMLFEEIESDTQTICDGYNFPWRLMADSKSNSLGGSDADTFTRNLYENAIIPEAQNRNEQLNRFFKLSDYGIRLDKDFSHVSVLQGDKVKEAQARKILNEGLLIEFQNNILTLNQWLTKLEEDPRPDEAGNLYYTDLLKLGWTFGAKAPAPANQDQNGNTGNQTGSAAAA